jgi:hypothetical protein
MRIGSSARSLVWLAGLSITAAACSGERKEPQSAAPATPVPISGQYQVEGVTREAATGNERKISGTVILAEAPDAARYTATFSMQTLFPTPEGATVDAQVVGKGEGTIEGDLLRGTSHTQIIWSEVPGVDSNFAFLPRTYGPRIVSKTETRFEKDGTLVIESDSQGEPGEEYRATHTSLRGRRLEVEPSEAAEPGAAP